MKGPDTEREKTPRPARTIITLVHGTWAKHAQWIQPDSPLYKELMSSVPGASITSFYWSGKNSGLARQKAAAELSVRLAKELEEFPHAKHLIIGHSHGGNVALRAVELAGGFDSIAVICLSTPFFHILPRNFGGERERSVMVAGLAFALIFAFVVAYLVLIEHPNGYLTFGLCFGFTAFLSFVAKLGKSWKRRADEMVKSITITVPETAKLGILRTVGDEASMAIATGQFFGWLSTTIIRKYVIVVSMLNRRIMTYANPRLALARENLARVIIFLIAIVGMVASSRLSSSVPGDWSSKTQLVFFGILCLTLLPMFATCASLVCVASISSLFPLGLAIMALASLPLGPDWFLTILFFEVTVESAPAGKWTITQLVPTQSSRLNHSTTYDDPNALRSIAAWI